MDCNGGDRLVNVSYRVKVKHAPCANLEVVLTPYFNDRVLTGQEGQAIRLVHAVSGTESDFRDAATLTLPAAVVDEPRCLRIRGELVDRSTGRILDDETTTVR